MNITKEFIPYEQSVLLKELGLKVKSPYYYNPNGVLLMKSFECDDETESVNVKNIIEYWDSVIKDRIDVPTFSQAFEFFRKKYNVHMYPTKYDETKWWVNWSTWTSKVFDTYEEAELDCLKKLIEIAQTH
jgi:hypothetical protein